MNALAPNAKPDKDEDALWSTVARKYRSEGEPMIRHIDVSVALNRQLEAMRSIYPETYMADEDWCRYAARSQEHAESKARALAASREYMRRRFGDPWPWFLDHPRGS